MAKCPGCHVTLVVPHGHEPGCSFSGLDSSEINTPTTAHELAALAVSRARLRQGMVLAIGSVDSKWQWDNRSAMVELDAKLKYALETLPSEIIAEAREITNAPI